MTARLLRITARCVVTCVALGLVAGVAAMLLLDTRLLVVRSGSMAPAIDTGALAVSVPVDVGSIEVGDVVAVRDRTGVLITHRVRSVQPSGTSAVLSLQGDANPVADAEPVVVDEAHRVILSVPRLGYVFAAVSGPLGMATLAVAGLALLALTVHRARSPRRLDSGRHRGLRPQGRVRTSRVAIPLASSIIAVGALHAMQGLVGTWAAYADSAGMAGPGFAAATVAPPTGVTCVNNGSQDYLTWTAPTGTAPTAYRIHVNGSATATAVVGPTVSQWRPATTLFPQTFANVRVVAVRGSWTSAPSATTDSISTLFLFQGTSC